MKNSVSNFDEKIETLNSCLNEFFVGDGALGYIVNFSVSELDREIAVEYLDFRHPNEKFNDKVSEFGPMIKIQPVKVKLINILYGL